MNNILLSKMDYLLEINLGSLIGSNLNRLKLCIVPFSFFPDDIGNSNIYEEAYTPGGKYYEELVPLFERQGFKESNISFLNYYSDEPTFTRNCIKQADVLFFPGGAPDLFISRLREKGLISTIQSFKGPIIGCSAGAMIQCSRFHITPNATYSKYCEIQGLGLLPLGVDVEVHFDSKAPQISCINKILNQYADTVVAIGNAGCAHFINDDIELIGDTKLFVAKKDY